MSGPFAAREPASMTLAGPAPFVTLRSFRLHGRRALWRARQSRKGLLRHPDQTEVPFWHKPAYNWWIGLLFAVGSLHFIGAAVLSMVPTSLPLWQIGLVFFLGSIFFTTAGFLQNLQAANAPDFSPAPPTPVKARELQLIGWRPSNLGWLSTITQFAGTVMFNFNTFDAIVPPPDWYIADLTIWLPGMIGSVLFLISGSLAFMEISHAYWSWKPKDLDWQIAFANLLGCIFFMTAGILAYIPRGPEPGWIATVANLHLCLGALGFLTGALLMMRESKQTATMTA